jgi:hypothetical protein
LESLPVETATNTKSPFVVAATSGSYIESQTHIGWNHLLLGCLSKLWIPLQQEYYESLGTKKSGCTWAVGLITQAWQLAWSHWEHRNHINNSTIHPDKRQQINILDDHIRDEYERVKLQVTHL